MKSLTQFTVLIERRATQRPIQIFAFSLALLASVFGMSAVRAQTAYDPKMSADLFSGMSTSSGPGPGSMTMMANRADSGSSSTSTTPVWSKSVGGTRYAKEIGRAHV